MTDDRWPMPLADWLARVEGKVPGGGSGKPLISGTPGLAEWSEQVRASISAHTLDAYIVSTIDAPGFSRKHRDWVVVDGPADVGFVRETRTPMPIVSYTDHSYALQHRFGTFLLYRET